MDILLARFREVFVFIYDILIVTKGTKQEHLDEVREILRVIDDAKTLLRAIHFGHADRDAMLRDAADVWWPRIHREIVEKAQKCTECLKAGTNLRCIKSQNEFGKLLETKEPNEEISLDFAGPFQNAIKQKKYLFVSVDNHSG